ncbi:MAG TPA: NAD-glutamate dehydrogenase [Trueperaceae bacterium]|nr:NAD-glutamate dehydrogenase [Trueperaceae bacterium]
MPATLEQVRKRIERAGGADGAVLTRFADILYDKADDAFLEEFDPDSLYAMAVDGVRFLEGGLEDGPRVQVFNPRFEADGWEAPYTVIRLLLADRPFIVDSVRAELGRHQVEVFHLLHPIVTPVRDAGGAVTALDGRAAAGAAGGANGKAGAGDRAGAGRGGREAFEMFFVERIEDAERRDALQAAVTRVLEDVLLATGDYRALRERALATGGYLQELKGRASAAGADGRREELDEYAAFMEWLDDDNFVFLGYREYDIAPVKGVPSLQVTPDSGLGILRKEGQSAYSEAVPIEELPDGLRERVTGGRVFVVTKTNAEATVHRPARMDYIGVKKLGDDWQVVGERRFLGLFTSKAHSTPVEDIPILRRKLRQVLDLDDALPGSHDYKGIVSVFNSMPREELFWSDAEQLHRDIRTILGLEQERGVRVTLRPDPLGRGIGVMVIMPRESFNAGVRRSVQGYLTEKLDADHVDYTLAMGEDQAQVRFHFFFTTDVRPESVDGKELERAVAEMARTWRDELRERLVAAHGAREGRALAERYADAFDPRYRADTGAGLAVKDIANLERMADAPVLADVLNPLDERGEDAATLVRIYHHGHGMALSDVLPVLENVGFRVLEQIPYMLTPQGGKRGIEVFRVRDHQGNALDVRRHRERLVDALERLLRGRAENDRLNRLVLYAELSVRQVALLRAYQMDFSQLNAVTSRRFINDTLLAHPQAAADLVTFFEDRFDPGIGEDRVQRMYRAREAVLADLAEVRSLPEDRTLRGLLDLMEATVRTNYFLGKDHISFKLASGKVASMPDPRPLFEIAVAGMGVEGVHLRGGKVARGGIRWSDRPDDFRTEILGLMKTQMTKNAVIVPVGSKGGFVLKRAPDGRDALRGYVREQYQEFIRGLLDLTDNRVDGRVVHPEGLVIYDDEDPYLVVAADKGTATFSDLANETAAAYGYWLGDAFASGGSQGYDHKELGITARGAWECVSRHFHELGVDVFRDAFSAVGVGDMSGDVFGNGMLYTDKLLLKAAFNHQHIFLDPDPDGPASFAERKRLFELPRSSWSDYDTGVISRGGGIFERGAKSIPLSREMRAMLEVEAEAMSGQDLVRAILKMPVDLLWNGGIGTYVRASSERDADVGDAANDPVRITAPELRCRVVGEGGNLGFTQLARIEYARGGGRINTDAIDNSAGVDTSDHEVNIKILLQPLVASGDLTDKQRNDLLREMAEEVASLVLRDNDQQSLALSLAERRSIEDLSLFESLLDDLADHGGLNPRVEFLPTRRQLQERQRSGEGLTRPELAVTMAYVKMGLYRVLLDTDLPDEPHFRHYLFEYFPKPLRKRYERAILEHTLRREITATQLTNTVVDLLGPSFVHRAVRDSGAGDVDVIKSALMALEVLDARGVAGRLERHDPGLPADAHYEALHQLVRAVEGVVSWMLFNDLTRRDVGDFVDTYRGPLQTLRSGIEGMLPTSERRRFRRRTKQLGGLGLEDDLASEIASLDYLPTSVGIIEVGRQTGVELEVAAKRFYALGERLALGWVRDGLGALPTEGSWEKIAAVGLVMDLREAQRLLATAFIEALKGDESLSAEGFLKRHPHLLERFDQALEELKQPGALTLAGGAVLVRLLAQAQRTGMVG